MAKYAPLVLRVGLAFVFLWFGYSQVTGPEAWVGLIPDFITNATGLSARTFVLLNGGFEIVAGILILFGIFTRIVAFLLFLHMVSIVFDVGLTMIGIRDIGIATGCLALSFLGKEV
jgi:uncharacterized membrane protein YphA (DoxX/SURF4 family)